MRIGVALLMTLLTSSGTLAFDMSVLPQSCKDTLAGLQSDKARFAALGKEMQRYRKAKDNPNFCTAAKATVTIIKEQSSKMDDCVGAAAGDKAVPPSAVDLVTQIR